MIWSLLWRRLLHAVVVFVGASFAVYCLVWLLPGDEARALFGFRRPDPVVLAELRAAYHLDEPLLEQYGRYLVNFLSGDLGPMYRLDIYGRAVDNGAVAPIVAAGIPTTARIVAVSVSIQLFVAVPAAITLGWGDSVRKRQAGIVIATLLVVLPAFVVAAAVRPVAVGALGTRFLNAEGWAQALLPGVVASLVPIALILRVLLTHARELSEDRWVNPKRALGMFEWRLRWVYGGRQVLVSAVTMVAAEIGPTLGGLLVVEQVFDIPGLGSTLLDAIRVQQGPLVSGAVMTFVAAMVVANLLADLAVLMLDPRTRAST